jgi:hypothetical protein
MEECIECKSMINLQHHHVIPRSMGGTATVLLCGNCHGKIHGLDFTNHGLLIRSGLNQARKKGIKLGRKSGTVMTNDEYILKHSDISMLLLDGYSVRKTSAMTDKCLSTVQRVKKILQKVKN